MVVHVGGFACCLIGYYLACSGLGSPRRHIAAASTTAQVTAQVTVKVKVKAMSNAITAAWRYRVEGR